MIYFRKKIFFVFVLGDIFTKGISTFDKYLSNYHKEIPIISVPITS
jgi:hypothetical protein